MYSYPFIRPLWFPTFLSPIPEEEEPLINDQASSQSDDFERFQNEGPSTVYGPEGALSNQNQSAPRVVGSDRKSIDSNSGRRTESVEVLKQKYLNDDIQDIPRLIQGPVRYGRLHRSRSHLNLGSQDIRTQLNKIRIRMRSNITGDEDRKLDYRCSKLKEQIGPSFNLESIGELLYGTPTLDDYDPELAALFEDYVEECDNPTRVTPETEGTLRDQYILGRILMERVLNSETRYAFLSGFMEGVYCNDGNSTESLDNVIENKQINTCTKDPCIDQKSFMDMIKNNQDITHKFLKEWEEQNRNTAQESLNDTQTRDSNAVQTEKAAKTTLEDPTKCDSAGSVVEKKMSRKRNVLPLGKTELDLAVSSESTNSPFRSKDPTNSTAAKNLFHRKLSKPGNPSNILTPDVPTLKGRKVTASSQYGLPKPESPLPTPAGDATRIDDVGNDWSLQDGTKSRGISEKGSVFDNELSYSPFRLSRTQSLSGNVDSFFTTDEDLCHSKYDLYQTDMKDTRESEADNDIGIIAMARRKLENKFMSSAIFEELCKRKQEKRSDVYKIKKETRDEGKSPSKIKPKPPKIDSPSLGDLDGWTTSTKHLIESDNLHMSSSELLHPVDSQEAFTPTVTAANTPVENQELKKLRDDSCGSRAGRQATPGRATPTSAKLSDLEDKNAPKLNYETNAFKHKSPLTGDFKSAAKHVKLRLTKSCANVPKLGSITDKAFVNVPLSKCNGYFVDDRMKPKSSVAPIITLSDRLAKQLRNIGSANEKIDNANACLKKDRNEASESNKAKTISVSLPPIENDSPSDHGISMSPFDDKLALPDIKKSLTICASFEKEPTTTCLKKQDTKIANDTQDYQDNAQNVPKKSVSIELPPISVKSYQRQNVTPCKNENSDIGRHLKDSYNQEFPDAFATGSIAVRAEVCTSPYNFDKCDPNKLLVKAKSVSNSHEVCIACGTLNEKEVSPDCKKKDKPNSVHKARENVNRLYCSKNDNKWKLDKAYRNDIEFPKLDVAKLVEKHNGNREIEHKKQCVPPNSGYCKQKARPGNDELAFKFMGQNIKLRFECEFSLGQEKEVKTSCNISDDKCKRLKEMAKPNCRDTMRNPVSRETGIYFSSKSKHDNFSSFHDSMQSPVRDSPYVEYCKRKSRMRCKRQQQMEIELAKLTEDVEQETEMYEKSETRKFPILPIKKSKEKLKGPSKKGKRKTNKQSPLAAKKDTEGLFVKPGRLPLLDPEQKSKLAAKAVDKDPMVRELENMCSSQEVDNILADLTSIPCEIRNQ